MRVAAIVVLAATVLGCAATDWDDVTFATSLDQSAEHVLQEARRTMRFDRKAALGALRETPAALRSDEHRLLQLRLLSSLGRHRTIMRMVENTDREFQERAFAEYLGPYLQACRQTGELDRFHRHMASLRYVENDASRKTMLHGVLSLFDEQRYDEARQMLDMYPPEMFPPHDWTVLRAAADLYAGHRDDAAARIDSALGLGGAGGAGKPLPVRHRAILYDLKLLASDWEHIGHSELMILSGAPLRSTRRNLAALALHHGLLDLASAKLDEIPANDSTRVLSALTHWERGDLPMADALLSLTAPEFLAHCRQGVLLRSELDYIDGLFREAERNYKQYLRMNAIPALSSSEESYANYAIGWAFHGYYKFSNAAYWWIKNLCDEQTSLFDSLATADLAALYTFTEHHDEARKYYRRLAKRYPGALHGDVITAYLDNLRMTGRYATLQSEFLRLYEEAPLEKRADFARTLGDVLYEREEWSAARGFYRLLPESDRDDEVVWRKERCAYLLGEIGDVVEFLNRFLTSWPQNAHAVPAALDLMRYYLATDQAELALAQQVPAAAPPDTVAFLRARALAMLGETQLARDTFETLTLGQSDLALRHRAVARLDAMTPSDKSEELTEISRYYSALADSVRLHALREDILLRLAARYEAFSLYREAIDVYAILMASPAYVDTSIVRLKLAQALMTLDQIDRANELLAPIEDEPAHPHRDEALHVAYFAAMARDDTNAARRRLLCLYRDYPDSPLYDLALIGLAELYDGAGQTLLAWWFYGKSSPYLGVARRMEVEQRLGELEQTIDETYGLDRSVDFSSLVQRLEQSIAP